MINLFNLILFFIKEYNRNTVLKKKHLLIDGLKTWNKVMLDLIFVKKKKFFFNLLIQPGTQLQPYKSVSILHHALD